MGVAVAFGRERLDQYDLVFSVQLSFQVFVEIVRSMVVLLTYGVFDAQQPVSASCRTESWAS